MGPLIIPDNVINIDDWAFQYCTKLTSIKLGKKVETIGYHTFAFCWQIQEEIIIPDSVVSLGTYVFIRCDLLPSVKISNNLELIPESAFSRCIGLRGELVIPESVIEIGIHAFYNCTGINSIKFNDKLKKIGEIAFQYCYSLEGPIRVPDSITEIGPNVFQYSKITQIYFYGTKQPTCPLAFPDQDLNSITVYVTEDYRDGTFCRLKTALIQPEESSSMIDESSSEEIVSVSEIIDSFSETAESTETIESDTELIDSISEMVESSSDEVESSSYEIESNLIIKSSSEIESRSDEFENISEIESISSHDKIEEPESNSEVIISSSEEIESSSEATESISEETRSIYETGESSSELGIIPEPSKSISEEAESASEIIESSFDITEKSTNEYEGTLETSRITPETVIATSSISGIKPITSTQTPYKSTGINEQTETEATSFDEFTEAASISYTEVPSEDDIEESIVEYINTTSEIIEITDNGFNSLEESEIRISEKVIDAKNASLIMINFHKTSIIIKENRKCASSQILYFVASKKESTIIIDKNVIKSKIGISSAFSPTVSISKNDVPLSFFNNISNGRITISYPFNDARLNLREVHNRRDDFCIFVSLAVKIVSFTHLLMFRKSSFKVSQIVENSVFLEEKNVNNINILFRELILCHSNSQITLTNANIFGNLNVYDNSNLFLEGNSNALDESKFTIIIEKSGIFDYLEKPVIFFEDKFNSIPSNIVLLNGPNVRKIDIVNFPIIGSPSFPRCVELGKRIVYNDGLKNDITYKCIEKDEVTLLIVTAKQVENNKLTGGIITGIVLCCLVFIGICAFVVFWYVKSKTVTQLSYSECELTSTS
ncbi:hypothetical protein M9Y10_014847 [Tritrichomonas musculus]|uniref:Surface antigen BspA-like n=1 Tax=Tritrichomonas musculus TaxID=1915356 RepID=A0ABR2L0N7_9EUKA